MLHAEGFKGFLIFLVAAGVIVPLFHRARISAVLGFLLVGVALGPHGFGRLAGDYPWLQYVTLDDPERAAPLAELGIIFLLFMLGLELSIDRLWQLRRYVLGVGLAQMALTTVAIGLVVRFVIAPPPAGLVLGLCLALSSTAIVMQLLAEQHRTATPLGRIALSVLLFQDLMVVPVLFVVGMLAGGRESGIVALVLPFVLALAAVPVLMGAGRYVVRPLMHSAGLTGSRELILALVLLIVVGFAAGAGAAGMSFALGAFLAGLLLSESEYRHQIEVDIEPFKGLLLGIFFIAVGSSVDPAVVSRHAVAIFGALAGLVAIKAAILFAVARAFRIGWATSAEVALLLAQAGEFAFVVIGIAQRGHLISPELASAAVAVAALSMMVTPLLAALARSAGRKLDRKDHGAAEPDADGSEFEDHVVIGGFGRVGQTVARLLEAENVAYVALDTNAQLVAEQSKLGRPVYFGDAGRAEMLTRVGAPRARAFVVTVNAPLAAEHMVTAACGMKSQALVFARAKDAEHAARLLELGAVGVIPETVEASLQLGGRLLETLGLPAEAVSQRLAVARVQEMIRPPQAGG